MRKRRHEEATIFQRRPQKSEREVERYGWLNCGASSKPHIQDMMLAEPSINEPSKEYKATAAHHIWGWWTSDLGPVRP